MEGLIGGCWQYNPPVLCYVPTPTSLSLSKLQICALVSAGKLQFHISQVKINTRGMHQQSIKDSNKQELHQELKTKMRGLLVLWKFESSFREI